MTPDRNYWQHSLQQILGFFCDLMKTSREFSHIQQQSDITEPGANIFSKLVTGLAPMMFFDLGTKVCLEQCIRLSKAQETNSRFLMLYWIRSSSIFRWSSLTGILSRWCESKALFRIQFTLSVLCFFNET